MEKNNLQKKLDECRRVRDDIDSQIYELFLSRVRINNGIRDIKFQLEKPVRRPRTEIKQRNLGGSYCCR